MTRERTVTYPVQLVVRIPQALADALEADAEANGRTVAQSARFLLARAVKATVKEPR